jgi:large conductance mechanosensitive channel
LDEGDVLAEEKRKEIITKKEVTMTLPVIIAPHWLQGFIDFVREQNVVSVAIGLIFGLAAKSLVDTMMIAVINPIVGVFLGTNNLDNKFFCLKSVDGICTSKLAWGTLLSSLINFLIILAIVYFMVKILKLDRLDKKYKKEE